MARFEEAIGAVLANEGGYVNDPSDRGGETNFGISKRSYPAEDIARLTRERAVEIYRRDFWQRMWDGITDQRVATKLLDLSVNMGAPRAVTLLQRAILDIGGTVLADGAFGPKTLAQVNQAPSEKLLFAFGNRAARYYFALCEGRPQNRGFLFGWLRRAFA